MTLNSAKTYTNEREVVIRQDFTTADATTLRDAKAHADAGDQTTLSSAKTYTDTKFADLENAFTDTSNRMAQDINKNRELAAQGIAGIAAMTNIPTPAVQGTSTVGMGVGNYDSKSAIAVGASHYFDNGVAIKGSFSSGLSSSKTTAVGAGVSYSWK